MSSRTTANREITATAIGAALATIAIILFETHTGTVAPPGLEGALATIIGALVAYIRKVIRHREARREALEEASE